jgi:hypothetical protein
MERKLPSGAKLKVNLAPFSEARALLRAIAAEAKDIPLRRTMDVIEVAKFIICSSLASESIEAALRPCLERCLYNGEKITADTFEDENARVDFIEVCLEVAKHNLAPFVKSLYAEYEMHIKRAMSILTSNTEEATTPS